MSGKKVTQEELKDIEQEDFNESYEEQEERYEKRQRALNRI